MKLGMDIMSFEISPLSVINNTNKTAALTLEIVGFEVLMAVSMKIAVFNFRDDRNTSATQCRVCSSFVW
jgi:hypothetical protein